MFEHEMEQGKKNLMYRDNCNNPLASMRSFETAEGGGERMALKI